MQMNVKSACLFAANAVGLVIGWCWSIHNTRTEEDIILPYQGLCPAQKNGIGFFEFNLSRLFVKQIPVYLLMTASFVCGFKAYNLLK